MSDNTPQIQEPTVALPASAPLVRITAGVGSAGQKTWNLRRPVTLIGSSRPAHIVLHDKDIAKAHCVIVNTGSDVLIKDLRTSAGTQCNRNPIDVAVLADGDVITIGSNNIQVAINLPEGTAEDSGVGLEYSDPVKFPRPVDVCLMHTEQKWTVEDAVVLIGRHELASIRLDHEDVSTRHAVVFRFGNLPAVFDLGGRTGIWVNGKRSSMATLADGDCLTVGPFGLSFGSPDLAALKTAVASQAPDPILQAVLPRALQPSVEETNVARDSGELSTRADTVTVASIEPGQNGEQELTTGIGDTWNRLNEWGTKSATSDSAPNESDPAVLLEARAAELDARDAALRGQLHDVTRMHENVVVRERELEQERTKLERVRAEIEQLQTNLVDAEREYQQRLAEVTSRENALTQRWSRLRSATCSHCGKPINVSQPPTA